MRKYIIICILCLLVEKPAFIILCTYAPQLMPTAIHRKMLNIKFIIWVVGGTELENFHNKFPI